MLFYGETVGISVELRWCHSLISVQVDFKKKLKSSLTGVQSTKQDIER